MLERHFRSLKAIDRIKAQWLGPQIERYAQFLDELHTSNSTVRQHVRALGHFNDFVIGRGATCLDDLPDHVDAFVEHWQAGHGRWCKRACLYKWICLAARKSKPAWSNWNEMSICCAIGLATTSCKKASC